MSKHIIKCYYNVPDEDRYKYVKIYDQPVYCMLYEDFLLIDQYEVVLEFHDSPPNKEVSDDWQYDYPRYMTLYLWKVLPSQALPEYYERVYMEEKKGYYFVDRLSFRLCGDMTRIEYVYDDNEVKTNEE